VGIAVKGRVTKKDCNDVLMPAMKKSLKRHDKIRLYYELNSRFPGVAWDDLQRWDRYGCSRQIGRLKVAPGSLRLPDLLRVPRLLRRAEDACLDPDDPNRGRQCRGREDGVGRAEVRHYQNGVMSPMFQGCKRGRQRIGSSIRRYTLLRLPYLS
jgi:hypothetical protein